MTYHPRRAPERRTLMPGSTPNFLLAVAVLAACAFVLAVLCVPLS